MDEVRVFILAGVGFAAIYLVRDLFGAKSDKPGLKGQLEEMWFSLVAVAAVVFFIYAVNKACFSG